MGVARNTGYANRNAQVDETPFQKSDLVPPALRELLRLTESPDPRIARNAKRKIEKFLNQTPKPEELELPPETKPLDEQDEDERRANASDLTEDWELTEYDEVVE